MEKISIQYLAGFFDGEGTIVLYKRKLKNIKQYLINSIIIASIIYLLIAIYLNIFKNQYFHYFMLIAIGGLIMGIWLSWSKRISNSGMVNRSSSESLLKK